MIRVEPISPAKPAAVPDLACLIASTAAAALMAAIAALFGSLA